MFGADVVNQEDCWLCQIVDVPGTGFHFVAASRPIDQAAVCQYCIALGVPIKRKVESAILNPSPNCPHGFAFSVSVQAMDEHAAPAAGIFGDSPAEIPNGILQLRDVRVMPRHLQPTGQPLFFPVLAGALHRAGVFAFGGPLLRNQRPGDKSLD